jgi:hypothetical protein
VGSPHRLQGRIIPASSSSWWFWWSLACGPTTLSSASASSWPLSLSHCLLVSSTHHELWDLSRSRTTSPRDPHLQDICKDACLKQHCVPGLGVDIVWGPQINVLHQRMLFLSQLKIIHFHVIPEPGCYRWSECDTPGFPVLCGRGLWWGQSVTCVVGRGPEDWEGDNLCLF